MSGTDANYLSDMRPDLTPFEIDCGDIGAYRYSASLEDRGFVSEILTSFR